jgi:hypothetical protein
MTKKSKIILIASSILLLSFAAAFSLYTPIGSPKTWLDVLGGIRVDSALRLPLNYNPSYTNTDSIGRIWYNTITKTIWFHDGITRRQIIDSGGGGSAVSVHYDSVGMIASTPSFLTTTSNVTSISTYVITAYVNMITHSSGNLKLSVSYTDETNTPRTRNIATVLTDVVASGATSIASTGSYQYPNFSIRCMNNTAITIGFGANIDSWTIDAGASITYDHR